MSERPYLRETDEGTILELSIQPKASSNAIVGVHQGTLKVRITAPPVEGAANKACIQLLAKTFGVPKTGTKLLKGGKSRRKTVLLRNLGLKDVERKLVQLGIDR